MFIQKITICLKNIYTDHKVYLEETNQDKILLDINSNDDNNNIIIYRTFDIYNENILTLHLSPTDKIRFSLGNQYKGEIVVNIIKISESNEDEYAPWINDEYVGI